MYSTNTKSFKLIFIGRPVLEKGLPDLLIALNIISPSYNWTLTILGEIPPLSIKPELEKLLQSSRITCVGSVHNSQICRLLNQHDIIIVPSHYENFGNVILEAMACGKVIIASYTGGLKEIIINGYNGIHFSPKDPVDLSVKLQMVFDMPELCESLSINSLKEVQQYSWPRILQKTIFLFKKYL